jgi:Cys-tRNA(Pro)/Cys-tRNA(Cys) deacylase
VPVAVRMMRTAARATLPAVARRRRDGGGTPALDALTAAGVPHAVRPYDHDSAASADLGYGGEAARALGADPARVFKTLVAEAGDDHVLAVVPVAARLDLKALARAAGAKRAALAERADAERLSGSVVGGISPLGGRTRLPVILDDSALGQPAILVSAGRRGLDVELAPEDLLRVTGGRAAPIAR